MYLIPLFRHDRLACVEAIIAGPAKSSSLRETPCSSATRHTHRHAAGRGIDSVGYPCRMHNVVMLRTQRAIRRSYGPVGLPRLMPDPAVCAVDGNQHAAAGLLTASGCAE